MEPAAVKDTWLEVLSPGSRKRPSGYMMREGGVLREGERVSTPAGAGVVSLIWSEHSKLGDLHLALALDSASPEEAKCRKHWIWQKLKKDQGVLQELGIPLECLYICNGPELEKLERIPIVPPGQAASDGLSIRYRCPETGCVVGPSTATLCATGEHVMCVPHVVSFKNRVRVEP